MPKQTRILGRAFVAVGALAALVTATAVPAAAAEPSAANVSSVEQDVDRLYQEVADLLQTPRPAKVLSNSKPLLASPIPEPGKKSSPAVAGSPDCTQGSLLTEVDKLAEHLTETELDAAGALSRLVELYASTVATDKSPQVFGTDGQYTPRATAAIDKLRGFWNIESWNIQLVAMKGTDAGSPEKMTQTFALGFDPARAAEAGELATKVTNEIPVLQGGRNPLLSLNAYSYDADNPGGKRITLGDGLLNVNNRSGFDDVSVEAVLGHEYGHQVDFANGNFPGDESGEMGPDAYAGYFLAHAKGEAWDARAQQEVTYLNASIGDCEHSHGTPEQRKAAGAWGEQQALKQFNPNQIVPSAKIIERFQQQYPKLMRTQNAAH
ncbi:M48 family metalloprotease [Amycolatopsis nalaikhensis]|uniref:M48 family metalloprotease n=1 Tax=Amycolatopsis nalaikhensis TaxID=715472 RepID=A0ABY8XAM6_9PSEU|nr:M48 family metalloprotease [Amycolatopsis sp. 2-2]WIV52970.1 M48 family metalloprotease [Amycolatopsis sp. 2-2]